MFGLRLSAVDLFSDHLYSSNVMLILAHNECYNPDRLLNPVLRNKQQMDIGVRGIYITFCDQHTVEPV